MTFPITGLPRSGMAPNVLVVGDPARAALAAEHLDGAESIAAKREYHSFSGSYAGTDVVVISHGVGSAGAGVCFSEILMAGAQRIIRAGTCGGLQDAVADGDLVVATGAVRADGYSIGVVPPEYPAVADPTLTQSLLTEADSAHHGIVLTSDVFYPSQVLGSNLELWQSANCIAVEMECAALFVAASLAGAQAAAVLTVDGNPLAKADESMEGYDPERAVVKDAINQMIDIALKALTT